MNDDRQLGRPTASPLFVSPQLDLLIYALVLYPDGNSADVEAVSELLAKLRDFREE